jgi:alpha-ketoglutarate-dependent taurine dioxygenase
MSDAMVMSRIEVLPVTGRMGAEIRGVNLRNPLSEEEITAIRAALLRWKVIFFRDQAMSPEEQIVFAKQFGPLAGDQVFGHAAGPQARPADKPQEVLVLGKVTERRYSSGDMWHTDLTTFINPPMGTILQGIEVPPYGGDTHWSNLAAAYEDLSPAMQRFLDGLWAEHRLGALRETDLGFQYPTAVTSRLSATHPRASAEDRYIVHHPVVRVHPETGERVLFINQHFTYRILDMSPLESVRILGLLFEHITGPKFTVRFRWAPGSVAFWDNRASLHMGPHDLNQLDLNFTRRLNRVTLAGDVPKGVDGQRSRRIRGNLIPIRADSSMPDPALPYPEELHPL